jgi:ABC-type transport system involved in multi-copper enzyme maturation permease subunit
MTTVVLVLVVAFVLLVAGWLFVGVFQARSLFRRELSAYFLSPVAYVVLFVFLIITGLLFYQTLDLLTARGARGVEFPMQKMLGEQTFWLVFLFIPPLLTMRLFAEERSTGTLEMLMTAPVRDWQVVLCKYAACFAFYVVLWLPTLVYLPILLDLQRPQFQWVLTGFSITILAGLAAIVISLLLALPRVGTGMRIFNLILFVAGVAALSLGAVGTYRGLHCDLLGLDIPADTEQLIVMNAGIDPWPVLSSYLGLALAGAMFLAIGLLISSLVRSQMVAALISLVLCLVFIVGRFLWPDLDTGEWWGRTLGFFTVPRHFYRDFTRGVVDTRNIVLYVSVAIFCLFMTVRSLESRRWR